MALSSLFVGVNCPKSDNLVFLMDKLGTMGRSGPMARRHR